MHLRAHLNSRLEATNNLSLSPREARAGREPERGANTDKEASSPRPSPPTAGGEGGAIVRRKRKGKQAHAPTTETARTISKEPFQLPPLFLGRPAEPCPNTESSILSRPRVLLRRGQIQEKLADALGSNTLIQERQDFEGAMDLSGENGDLLIDARVARRFHGGAADLDVARIAGSRSQRTAFVQPHRPEPLVDAYTFRCFHQVKPRKEGAGSMLAAQAGWFDARDLDASRRTRGGTSQTTISPATFSWRGGAADGTGVNGAFSNRVRPSSERR